MRLLLPIRIALPRSGETVWCGDQHAARPHILMGDKITGYAFTGQNPKAAHNRWLREAFERTVPIVYFLGIAPGLYEAILLTFIAGWDAEALMAQVTFAAPAKRRRRTPPQGRSTAMLCALCGRDRIRQHSAQPSSPHIRAVARARVGPSRACATRHTSFPAGTSRWARRWYPMCFRPQRSITRHLATV